MVSNPRYLAALINPWKSSADIVVVSPAGIFFPLARILWNIIGTTTVPGGLFSGDHRNFRYSQVPDK
jgi:hypothetical protein